MMMIACVCVCWLWKSLVFAKAALNTSTLGFTTRTLTTSALLTLYGLDVECVYSVVENLVGHGTAKNQVLYAFWR